MKDLKLDKNKIIILVVGLLILVSIWVYAAGFFKTAEEKPKEIVIKNNVVCFMGKDESNMDTKEGEAFDYEVVKMEFIEGTNRVKGFYNIIPFGIDSTRGTFKGEIGEDALVDVDYTYQMEGEQNEDKLNFKIIEQGLNIQGRILKKVSCSDSEFEFNIRPFNS